MVVFLGHSGALDLERPAIVVGTILVNALGNDGQTLAPDPVGDVRLRRSPDRLPRR